MRKITLVLTQLLFMVLLASAQDYYVALNGSDSSDGTISKPWRSIQHAMDNATPGSTVFIREGVYNEKVYVNVSGEEGNPITFTAFEGEDVTLDGGGLSDEAMLALYDVQYIVLQGFAVRNNTVHDAIGIIVEGVCNDITIADMVISEIHFSSNPSDEVNDDTNSQPIIVYGTEADHPITNLVISGNEIFDCRTGFSEALAVNGNVDGFLVEDNYVHDVSNIGIDVIGHEGTCSDPSLDQARNGIIRNNRTARCTSPYATSAGIYVDGGRDLIIEGNEVYENQWGIEIGCENVGTSASDIVVRNNVIYRNTSAGVHIGGYDYPSGSGKVTDVHLLNNTITDNDLEDDGTGELFLSYFENVVIANNIFFGKAGSGYLCSTDDLPEQSIGLQMDHNDWYSVLGSGQEEFYWRGMDIQGLDEFTSETGFEANGLNVDPAFASAGMDLEPGSPLVDVGTMQYIGISGSVDFEGDTRLVNGNIDIGARELQSSTSLADPGFVAFAMYPNPTRDYVILEFPNAASGTIEITDVMGKTMTRQQIRGSRVEVSLPDWPSGVYLVYFTDPSGSRPGAPEMLVVN